MSGSLTALIHRWARRSRRRRAASGPSRQVWPATTPTSSFASPATPLATVDERASPKAVVVATDHSTATKVNNDQIKVVFDNANASQYSSNNAFLARAATGSISGTVYNDANGDGLAAGETGLSGVTVTRSGTSSGTTTTLADGTYTFTGLAAGTYAVAYTVPTGYANTGAATSISGIVLAGGGSSSGQRLLRAAHDLDGDRADHWREPQRLRRAAPHSPRR